jgi:hypothetical protein
MTKRDRVERYLYYHLAMGQTEFLTADVAKELDLTCREAGRLMCDCFTENNYQTRSNQKGVFRNRRRVRGVQ